MNRVLPLLAATLLLSLPLVAAAPAQPVQTPPAPTQPALGKSIEKGSTVNTEYSLETQTARSQGLFTKKYPELGARCASAVK